MIAGFIAIIVLIEAPVLTRPQSSSCNARREQGVITPLGPLRRDRETETRGRIRISKGWGRSSSRLGGVNFGFWSHLVCSGQNTIIFSREGLI